LHAGIMHAKKYKDFIKLKEKKFSKKRA